MRKVPLFLLPLGFAFSLQAQTADVAVTKSGPATITAGGPNATYTITVTNNGPNSASVTLNDSPSQSANAPLFFVSWTQNSGPTVTCATPSPGNSGTIDCIATTFGSSQSASFTLVESLPAAVLAGNSVPNSATAFVNAATDPVPGNNTATVTSATTDSTPGNNSSTAPVTASTGSAAIPTLSQAMLALLMLALGALGVLMLKR